MDKISVLPLNIDNKSRFLKDIEDQKEDKKLKEACAGFEAIMLNTILKSMRKTLPEGGIFDRSHARDIWESYMDQEISEKISKGSASPGLRDFLYKQLSRPESSDLKS